jgi:hypothetical protein
MSESEGMLCSVQPNGCQMVWGLSITHNFSSQKIVTFIAHYFPFLLCHRIAQQWYACPAKHIVLEPKMLTCIGSDQEAHNGARKVGSRGSPGSHPPPVRVRRR